MQSRRHIALLFRLLVLAISSLIGIGLAEAGVRLIEPQSLSVWSMTRDGFVVHRAGIRGGLTAHGRRLDTNSIGMRDVEHDRTKPEGTFRILLFGDSFMEAAQVEWTDSLPALLQERLSLTLSRPVEVVNLAISGWGTDVQLAYFERHASDYDPDLVLLAMTLHNDVADNLQERFFVVEEGELRPRPAEPLPLPVFLRQRIQEWLAGHSHLYQRLAASLRSSRVVESGRALDAHVAELLAREPGARIAAGWAHTQLLLDRFAARSAEQGASFAVFMIPLVYGVVDARYDALVEAHGVGSDALDPTRPQTVMKAWGEAKEVPVIDLQPGFRVWARETDQDPYDTSDGHWDASGHRLGAELVAAALVASPVFELDAR